GKCSLSRFRKSVPQHAINELTVAGLPEDTITTRQHDSILLSPEPNQTPIPAEKAILVQTLYQKKMADLDAGFLAYQSFCDLSQQKPLDSAKAALLLERYKLFQPWLFSMTAAKSSIDSRMVSAFNEAPLNEYALQTAVPKIIEQRADFQGFYDEQKRFY